MNALLALMASTEASGAGAAGSMTTTLVTFVLIILIFYFLIIRPQKKKDKEAKAMLAAIKKGDKVVSIGGIHGTVVAVKDTTIVVKVDDNARIEFSKNAISTVLNKAAEKSAPKKAKKDDAKAVEADVTTPENTAAEEPKTDAPAPETK